jgi:alanine dehydrogenase
VLGVKQMRPASHRKSEHRSRLLLLRQDQIHALLNVSALNQALERAFIELSAGRASVPNRIAASTPDGCLLLAMPGYVDKTLAAKLVTIFPGNHERSLPSHHAVIVLFDDQTGEPISLLDGTAITAIRTAATTAIATNLLARRDASVLAILGAGVQGQAHLQAVPRVRPFREVRLASRNPVDAEAVAAGHSGVRVSRSFEEAVRGADVVCTCTDASEPVFKFRWLKTGAHVNSVGFGKGPEIDAATTRSARLFVESRSAFQPRPTGAHELQGLDPQSAAELGEVLSGARAGRTTDTDLTVFKSTGHAAEDAAAARLIYELATERRVGQPIYL